MIFIAFDVLRQEPGETTFTSLGSGIQRRFTRIPYFTASVIRIVPRSTTDDSDNYVVKVDIRACFDLVGKYAG